ncbi:hypothetical protein GPB2148_1311 [marine gamma proteobacterium HTCC2148]|nr:hypothetical protein GPB2148_1311 [marine gamma proteobacterium HTCC2148]
MNNIPVHIADAIELADKGDKSAAMDLLSWYVATIDDAETLKRDPDLHPALLIYLSDRLRKIVEGVPAELALGLSSTFVGRKADKERNIAIWLAVSEFLEEGSSLRQAALKTRKKLKLPMGERRVQDVYNEVNKALDTSMK